MPKCKLCTDPFALWEWKEIEGRNKLVNPYTGRLHECKRNTPSQISAGSSVKDENGWRNKEGTWFPTEEFSKKMKVKMALVSIYCLLCHDYYNLASPCEHNNSFQRRKSYGKWSKWKR